MLNFYARATRWLSGPHVGRRVAALAFVCALPSLASWFAAPFESLRNLERTPFQPGDRIALPDFEVEVREVDKAGAPTRVRFTFRRVLEDPELAFQQWQGASIARWTPPPVGAPVQLLAAAAP